MSIRSFPESSFIKHAAQRELLEVVWQQAGTGPLAGQSCSLHGRSAPACLVALGLHMQAPTDGKESQDLTALWAQDTDCNPGTQGVTTHATEKLFLTCQTSGQLMEDVS